ncbi:putative signal transducing protein [Luteimonas sp. A501]
MFTTVAAYTDPIEAQLAAGLLQAEGIPARLDDTGTAIANWEWRLAIGGMRLRVPDAQAIHARRVLAALDAGEYALDEDALDDGALHEATPEEARHRGHALQPGRDHGLEASRDGTGGTAARDARDRLHPPDRESLSSRIAWAALMLLGLPLPWRRQRDDDAVVRRA